MFDVDRVAGGLDGRTADSRNRSPTTLSVAMPLDAATM